jgi:glyoxylase-like metal-dependent hydrolase (beta-lactamase superfamily II)
MYIKQFYLGCLSIASYLIGDDKTKEAVIVDPLRDIDQYIEESAKHGYTIKHVLLTHFHADFVSGHLELKDRLDATIYMGDKAHADFPFTKLADGKGIEFGNVKITALSTPGHTPEAVCYLVYDLEKDKTAPHAVLTGDTLFIGDVGRPDLFASSGISTNELAGLLYDSLHEKLLSLPDETIVYPGHGAGSMCGKNLSSETVSTIGAQRKFNYALKPMSKEDFIKAIACDQPNVPKYFSKSAQLNRQERTMLHHNLEEKLNPLTLDEVLRLINEGAQVLDTRDPNAFAKEHLCDSINIGLGGKYATWAGTVLHHSEPIVLICEPGTQGEAATRLGRIGYDHIAGFLNGGIQTIASRPDLKASFKRVSAQETFDLAKQDKEIVILDVRNKGEWAASHIEGAMHIPLDELEDNIKKLPRDKKLLIHCAGGYRSSIAASILMKHDFKDLTDMIGGMSAWEKAKLPVKSAVAAH